MKTIIQTKRSALEIAVASLALAVMMGTQVQAATIPATWDLGSDTGKDDLSDFTLVETATSTWTLQPDAARVVTEDAQTSLQIIEVPGLAGNGFSISSTITLSDRSGSGTFSRFGISFLGDNNATSGYVATMQFNGTTGTPDLRFRSGGLNGSSFSSTTWDGLAIQGTTYTFEIDGEYNISGDLLLDFKVTDSNNYSQAIQNTFTSPLNGNYIGVGGRMRNNHTADFHDLTIIPEPSSLALLGLAGLAGLLVMKRRKV